MHVVVVRDEELTVIVLHPVIGEPLILMVSTYDADVPLADAVKLMIFPVAHCHPVLK